MTTIIPTTPEHILIWQQHFSIYDWAVDCDHRKMKKSDYGKLTDYGWEIDHIVPLALGGADTLANKRPRHWRGNRAAGSSINALANALAGKKTGLF